MMTRGRQLRFFAVVVSLLVLVSACGELHAGHPPPGGPGPSPSPLPGPEPGPPPGPPPPATARLWSDVDAWPDGQVPAEGDVVTIAMGDTVLLDISPPPLGGLAINGALVFDDQDLELTSDWIMVHGGLHVGSQDAPFEHQATITLTGPWSDADVMPNMGAKVLGAMHGGRIELYGRVDGPSWTRLTDHTAPGHSQITVEDASGWEVGDRIALASTDFEMFDHGYEQGDHRRRDVQVEERTITEVNGLTLTLDEPLQVPRVGRTEVIDGVLIDQRAEVARLTRNVVVQGDLASADPGSDSYRFGGHVMIMANSVGIFEGIEFRRMGQIGVLARYPVHYHLLRDFGEFSYVGSSSIHSSFHRCLTIHGTNHLRVYDVAAYDTYGHCFFFEDAAEEGNVLRRNLALMIRKPPSDQAVLMSDTHHFGPAGFWVTNPANDLIGNVAASSAGTGFWYALPPGPTGLFPIVHPGVAFYPQTTPLGLFVDNVAHSNGQTGLHVDNGPTLDLSGVPATSYRPRVDPSDPRSDPVTAVFQDFVAYKHRDAGAWFRGDNTILRGGVLSDNAVGVTFASRFSWAEEVSFVGETSNLGHPRNWERHNGQVGLDGRSLPKPWQPHFVIRGYEFYDGDVHVHDSFFTRYEPNGQREAAALSYKDFTDWPVSPLNAASGLRFAAGTNPVYLATRTPGPSNLREDGYRSAVFRDLDGSVTGIAGSVVTVDNPFLHSEGCSHRPDWNAWVCSDRYASLTLVDVPSPASGLGPVTIRRSDGEEHIMGGMPDRDPRVRFRTLLRLDDSYAYDFAGTSDHLELQLWDVGTGDQVLVSLPYPEDTPFIYRDWINDHPQWGSRMDPVASLETLQNSSESGFFHESGILHVRIVQQDAFPFALVHVCRRQGCD